MAQPERARPARHRRGSQPPPAPRCGQGPGPGAGGCFPLGLGLGPAAGCTKAGLCAGEARRSVRGLEANAATSSPRCNYSHALPTSISTPRWLLAPLATPGFLLVALGCRLHPAALRAPGRPGLDVQRLRAAAAEQVSGGDTGRDGAPTGKETKGQEGPRPSPILLAPHLCSSSCSEPSSARAGQEGPRQEDSQQDPAATAGDGNKQRGSPAPARAVLCPKKMGQRWHGRRIASDLVWTQG